MQETTLDPRLLRVVLVMTVVTLPLKGWALWRASRSEQKAWFIALLIFNSLGILELTYLFYFSKQPRKDHE